ncbi:autotransporter serine protease fusolisin [Fusobacterium canifelinum]|uniref:Autotransporter serine protease fusolisin n=1 Tax=Fusobacterium canifelinum TaxID=285729 RepID=A0ABX7CE77_9FUSO|nr:autotransporter serine protease fusolisin [Fusobacterium canifelinum]QQS87391.1 autotransporter serine protease fusolisin [Fusobacterium canifelinum]
MKRKILKSKMFLIALASILFVSCGGGGGGGGGGSSNLPVKPGRTTPTTPTVNDPAYNFPTTSNPLDNRKGNMSALKTSLYSDQVNSGVSVPKDTRETNGLVAGVSEGKLEGQNVKVAILDSNFQDAVRTSVEDKDGKTVDKNGHALVPRRNRTLTAIYTDVDILAHPNKYSENAISGTERATSLEHGEEVLEVVRDIEYAPNHLATTYAGAIGGNNPRNKINVILGTVGLDYKSKRDNKEKIGAIIPKQETYDAALASFGNQSVKIFNQSFGSDESYEDRKYAAYENSGESPLYFFKSSATDTSKPMIPYFKDVVNNKGGLFIWSAGNTKNRASSLDAGLPFFDQSLEKGWISVVGVIAKKDDGYFTTYNVLGDLSKAGSDAAYWSISADERGMKKIVSVDAQGNASISTGIGSSYAAPRVTRAAALVYEKYDWMTNDQIRQTLFTTTDETNVTFRKPGRRVRSSPDSTYGWGMLNQARALKGPGAFMNVSSNRSASKVFNANVPSGTTSYFDNDIFGDGGLRKLGDGTLHLTGNNSFSGGSTVTAGTLEIHQIHSSPITVGTNGTLVLNPKAIVGYDSWAWETIDTVSPQKITDSGLKVKNYGTVRFDGTTAIIGGDYVAYAGSDTQVGFKNSVKVLGKIRIQNGNVSVLSNDYVSQNEKATIMQGNSFEGNIAKVETNGMRTANVEVKDGKVVATMSRQNPVEYVGEEAEASTKNVAENVEKVFQDLDQKVLSGTATKEELTMGSTLQNMTTTGFVSATEMMSGEVYASAQALTFSQAQNVNRDLSNRLAGLDNFKNSNKDSEVWFSVLGSGGKLRRDGYASADTRVTGGQFGIDTKFEGTTTLGVALNYSYAKANFNRYAGESKSNMVGVSFYGKQELPYGFYTAGRLGLSNVSSKVERELLTSTGETLTGKINHHDKMLSAYVEIGKKIGWFTPFIGYSQDYLRRGSFNESEASWGIKADSKNYRATNFLVGARAEYVGDKYKLQAYVTQAINTDKRDLTYEGNFTGSNVRQKFQGVKQAKNTTWIGFGVFREISPVFGVYGNVDFRVEDKKWADSVISTGLQYRF